MTSGVELEGSVQATRRPSDRGLYLHRCKTNDTGSGDRRSSLIPRHQPPSGATTRCSGPVSRAVSTGVRYRPSVGIGAVDADNPIYGSAHCRPRRCGMR